MNTEALNNNEKIKSLALIFKASRIIKVLPVLFLIINGALVTGTIASIYPFFLPLVLVVAVAILGMQLNVITDAQVDKKHKPYLFDWLMRDKKTSNSVFIFEIGVVILLLMIILKTQEIRVFLSLLMVSVLSILYSYNFFFMQNPAKYRLKLFWWGHMGTIWFSYFGLWFTGFLLGGHSAEGNLLMWMIFFLCLSLLDYAIFLCESSSDAIEEREFKYHTLPALLGGPKTCWFAFSIWGLALFCFFTTLQYLPVERQKIVFLAFFPCIFVQCVTVFLMIYLLGRKRNFKTLNKIIDCSFWSSRLATTFILLGEMLFNTH